MLKLGSRGQEVKEIQQILNLHSDGIYGPLTEEAVKAFQKEHNIKADGIVGQKTLLEIKKHHNSECEYVEVNGFKKSKRNIKRIILHCSATPEGKDFTTEDIKRWHLQRGFSDIGYHYIIYRDGSIHNGRDVNISGAHTENYNSTSLGICYIGGCDSSGTKAKDTRTIQQKAALYTILKAMRHLYPNATIHGHYEFANKDCPSFKVDEYKGI